MQTVTTYLDDLAVLTELIDTGNDMASVKAALCIAMPTLSKDMVLADVTLATFTGSTPKAITWGTPFIGTGGVPEVDSQLLAFISSGSPPGENVVGFVITDSAGVVLKHAIKFDDVQPVPGSGHGVSFVFQFRRYDVSAVVVP